METNPVSRGRGVAIPLQAAVTGVPGPTVPGLAAKLAVLTVTGPLAASIV